MVTCKLCGRESNMAIEEGSVKSYNGENGGKQQMVAFDCRGLEPVEVLKNNHTFLYLKILIFIFVFFVLQRFLKFFFEIFFVKFFSVSFQVPF